MINQIILMVQLFVGKQIKPTMDAILRTSNKWRGKSRLWLDGGKKPHVFWGKLVGLIETKPSKYYLGRETMVRLTMTGVTVSIILDNNLQERNND